MTETSAAVSMRGMRALRPSDVAAMAALADSAPAVLARLRDGVVLACARIPSDLAADVCGVAMVTVARHYGACVTPDREASAVEAHAVARAVRMARQTVATALVDSPEVPFDPTDRDEVTSLEHWQAARPDGIAQTNVLREAWEELLAMAGPEVGSAWDAIARAWTGHDAQVCEHCLRPGARPGSVTLGTIRAHVAGLPTSGAGATMRRHDVRTVEAVAQVVAPLAARARGAAPVIAWDEARGDVWDAFGVAWAMVTRGDGLAPVVTPAPEGLLTVDRDGVPSYRPVGEAEAAQAARPNRARERMATHAGEGDDRDGSTAPNLRDVSPASGMLRAFKPVVSPRKRAAGQTGPTVPVTLGHGDATMPRAHDAGRAARYDDLRAARVRADAVRVGVLLPE